MRKRNFIFLILFLAYLGMVAYCCFGHFDNMPQVDQTLWGIPMDKVVHFIMFFPFPIFCYLAFSRKTSSWWRVLGGVVIVFLLGCALAAGTEVLQSFTNYRSGDKLDFMADMLSLSLSSIITLAVAMIGTRRRSNDENC